MESERPYSLNESKPEPTFWIWRRVLLERKNEGERAMQIIRVCRDGYNRVRKKRRGRRRRESKETQGKQER